VEETNAAEETYSEACRRCSHWKEVKERVRLMELLESAINKMQKALTEEAFKPTVGDYVKLMQMEKEMDEAISDAKEIRVKWVETTDSERAE
jgi:thiamine biosynthesis lipoprotein ApbE